MPVENVTVDDLKKDQERLQAELAKMEEYFGKKKEKPLKKPPETIKQEIPVEKDELLKKQLEESKKIMEKFDYLIDILLSTTEEEGNEEMEKAIYTLAQTQSHVLNALSSIKEVVEKTDDDMPSKEELVKFEEDQRNRYNELNDKMNMLIEKVEKPSYLKELDAIRVGVSNILTELKRLEEEGEEAQQVRQKAEELTQQVNKVEQQVVQAPQPAQAPEVEQDVKDMSAKVDELEKTLKMLAKTKKEPTPTSIYGEQVYQ